MQGTCVFMRSEASAANNVPLCSWKIVWFRLGGRSVILCYKKTWEELWSVAHVANMTSLQAIIRTPWANCKHWLHYHWFHNAVTSDSCLKTCAAVHCNALNCLTCLQGVRIWTPNHHQPPAECFCDIWLWFGIYQPLWQVTSPRLEVLLFSDISAGWWNCLQGWLILAGNTLFSALISSPFHSVLEANEDVTITTHQQQGPTGKTGGQLVTHFADC